MGTFYNVVGLFFAAMSIITVVGMVRVVADTECWPGLPVMHVP
jgi:hypothetical protein